MPRLRLPVAAVAAALALVTLVGCAAETSTTGSTAASPAARTQSARATPAPTATAASGHWYQFALPNLPAGDPNAVNVARHGRSGSPLLLFLPATGAVPADYRALLRTAHAAGYSVLGLDYFNIGRSLTRTCRGDAACYGRFQRNRFDGSDPSRVSRVDAEGSILHRLRSSITYLANHDPAGDWGRFLDGRSIRWADVVVAGHSQGGGEAAFISHHYRVRGVLMFASPVETYEDVTAQWIETPGKTPPSLMYGLDDVGDMYRNRILPTWQKLGMGTADPDAATIAPTGSHTLVTSLDLGTPRDAHDHVATDATPRDAKGVPRLQPSWRWMLDQVVG